MDDNVVTDLDVGLAGCEFLVAKVQDAEAVELIGRPVFRDEERGVAIGAALREGALIEDA